MNVNVRSPFAFGCLKRNFKQLFIAQPQYGRGDHPCRGSLGNASHDLMHFLCTFCIVRFIQKDLLLRISHGTVRVQRRRVHGQRHAKSDGYLVKIHRSTSVIINCAAVSRTHSYDAASSMLSIKIPYPLVGSFTRTWVTAPTSFPS